MSAGRLFQIVYLLLQNKRMTAAELAERFEVSVRTIYRDIDALSAAGVPVFSTPGSGGGIALMEHYVLDRATFSDEEQQQLLTALQSLSGQTQTDVGAVLEKLSGLFQRREPDWLQVDLSRWGSAGTDSARFSALKRAALEHRVITFMYVSAYGAAARRRALPGRLVYKDKAWYLQAFCLERQDWRAFKLTRMLELEVLDSSLTPPSSPPPLGTADPPSASLLPIRLRFSPAMAFRVYDEFDQSCITRETDGSLLVSVTFPEDAWVYGYLLSFGLSVQILAPDALRRRLGALAREIGHSHLNLDKGCQECGATMGPSYKQEGPIMELKFCQSCGMPLTDPELAGSERDGTPSPHYCKYCYQKGAFTGEMTMEEMIDFCTPMMVQANPGMTEEQARAQMFKFFPMLLRWKK